MTLKKAAPEAANDDGDWSDLAPYQRAAAAHVVAPVKIGMASIGKTGRIRMSVVVEKRLLDALGGKTSRFRIRLSKEVDRLAIEPDGDIESMECPGLQGTSEPKQMLRVAPDDRLPRFKIPGTACEFQAEAKRLIIHLPPWAYDTAAREIAEDASDVDDAARHRRKAMAKRIAEKPEAILQVSMPSEVLRRSAEKVGLVERPGGPLSESAQHRRAMALGGRGR